MSKETVEKTNENKKAYELAFHIVPTLGDDNANNVFEEITTLIEKNSGKIVSKSEPTLLNLEYQMEKTVDSTKGKYYTAYFAWFIFENGDVIKIDEEMKHHKSVLRHLLIKTTQKDSTQTSEVAALLDNDMDENREMGMENVEVEIESVEDLPSAETEEEVAVTEDQAKVDEAIDELVK